jgi:flavin reductase (DIM6/NTAB) family NADH-FMN oxidoreductase RutF
VNEAGKPNIITLAWVGVVNSDPPMIGISIRPERYSHACVKQSREFVVNLPSEEMVRKVDACGVLSGRETDKFSSMEWKQVTAQKVRPPLIDECPVQMECRVKQMISLEAMISFWEIGLHVRRRFKRRKVESIS